jgi:hypothetical protein
MTLPSDEWDTLSRYSQHKVGVLSVQSNSYQGLPYQER